MMTTFLDSLQQERSGIKVEKKGRTLSLRLVRNSEASVFLALVAEIKRRVGEGYRVVAEHGDADSAGQHCTLIVLELHQG